MSIKPYGLNRGRLNSRISEKPWRSKSWKLNRFERRLNIITFLTQPWSYLILLARMGHADHEITAAFSRFDYDGNQVLDREEQERMKAELEEKRVCTWFSINTYPMANGFNCTREVTSLIFCFCMFLRRLSALNSTSSGWSTIKVQRRRRLLTQLRRKPPIKPQRSIGRFRGEMTILSIETPSAIVLEQLRTHCVNITRPTSTL